MLDVRFSTTDGREREREYSQQSRTAGWFDYEHRFTEHEHDIRSS